MPVPSFVTQFLSGLSGYGQGMLNNITNTISSAVNGSTHGYNNITDDEETNTEVAKYRTVVHCGEPIRKTKFLFVPELVELYSASELNTAYHSVDEYQHAVDKYGYIYKTQKFENADTTQKLFDYAKDWIKNNYHGGITSFTVTALDMHIIDRNDFQKFTVGRRVPIVYIDPDLRQETRQSLTCISAEYDLNNPEKNQYKIGIPDIALNKVYGETSKKGGGGGGGKSSDETDDETNTEVDGLGDLTQTIDSFLDEKTWAHLFTMNNSDDGSGFDLSSLLTPGEKDPTGNTFFAMTADGFKSTFIEGAKATVTDIISKYISVEGGVDADKISANTSNTGRTNATSIDVVDTATAKTIKSREDVESERDIKAAGDITAGTDGKVKGKTGEFTTFKLNGNTIGFSVNSSGHPRITINGTTYTLVTE